ncbi:1-phosphatidylinositol phosphodiesterase [Kitasatospora sp. MAP12-15]|uniref:phosphatidylinositol-specific phospholipase C n=1 Tax=unclassified Kitasatospora TaxID=2633591 RepID=UPI00247589E9|nr:phosphatidylinositol-specific phospholipase C [Kitasatospora sp. MAP12-44]MDH6114513.1 1-phosphatidylinositol phosphodiesterase [Kitasatospora sp. MAP12-44]
MDLTDARFGRRSFARSALVLGAAGLGLTRATSRARAADLPTGAGLPGGADWMGALAGGGYLSQLTIPGTHDTCSRYGGALTQTQTLAVPDQLAAGVRFLDMRCRLINGVFAIHHGPIFQQIFFGDVLNLCQAFLAQHPGETVLMRVKQEYSTASDADFAAVFAGYQAKWQGLLWAENRIPQLGEVRGRIVVLADSSGLPGIPWGGASTDIEDDYDIGTIFEIASRKWPEVSAHLDAARASTDSQKLYITFTTSSGWGLWPQQAAEAMAPRISGYLAGLNAAARPLLGTVPMDFVTPATVQPFYALNFGA